MPGGGLIVIEYVRFVETPAASVTVTLMPDVVPVAVGVPEIVPVVVSIESPFGKPVAAHVYGAVPVPAVTATGVPG